MDRHAFADRSFFDSAENNNSLIGIIDRIKDQCLQRCLRITLWCRDLLYDLFQYLIHILSGLCRDPWCVMCLYSDHILNFFDHSLRLCTGKINLVDDRHHIQIMIQRQIYIG